MRSFEVVKNESRAHPNIEVILPSRADKRSAGYDFYSCEDYVIEPNGYHVFWTDVKARMYYDNVLEIYTRSGNGAKRGIVLRNNVGIIDSSYYNNPSNDGNIGICLYNSSEEPFTVSVGDRIAQGIFKRYLITNDDTFSETEVKRSGGFGSSGK